MLQVAVWIPFRHPHLLSFSFLLSKQIDKSCGGGRLKAQDCCKMPACTDLCWTVRGLKAESFSSQQQLWSHSVFGSCRSSLDVTSGHLHSQEGWLEHTVSSSDSHPGANPSRSSRLLWHSPSPWVCWWTSSLKAPCPFRPKCAALVKTSVHVTLGPAHFPIAD